MNDIRFIDLNVVEFHTGALNLLVVNIDKIEYFMPCDDSENTIIGLGADTEFRVVQSIREIKDLIRKAEQSSNVFQT